MQILIGLASGLLFFSFLICAFYAGYQFGIRTKPNENVSQIDKKELERMKRRQREFQNMMDYTVEQAMGVKHE